MVATNYKLLNYELQVLELKQSAVVLLEAMCEETHQDSKKLVQNIHKAIDIGALHDTFYYFHQMSEDDYMVSASLFTLKFEVNVCIPHRKLKKKMMMQKEQPLELTMY